MQPHDIPPDIQRRWLEWLRRSFERINREELGGRLSTPTFALDGAQRRLGLWEPRLRAIHVAVDHIAAAPSWLHVEQTLRHEMAHQLVSEVYGVDGAPHGPAFQRACGELGLDSAAAQAAPMTPAQQRILARVKKLLRLGASPNQHEAEAAVAAASRLLLRHNLAPPDDSLPDDYVYQWALPPVGRIVTERKVISGLLQEFFFVRAIWIGTHDPHSGRATNVLELMGRRHNVLLADHAHGFLLTALDRLWERYRRDLAAGERGRAVRNAYRNGVLLGFRETLEAQRRQHREQGLVWVGDGHLERFARGRHPRTRSLARGVVRLGRAHEEGLAAGRALRLHGPVEGSRPRRRGRRLPPSS